MSSSFLKKTLLALALQALLAQGVAWSTPLDLQPEMQPRLDAIKADMPYAMKLFLYAEKYFNHWKNQWAKTPQKFETYRLSLGVFHPEYIEFPADHPNLYKMENYSDWIVDKAGKGPYAYIADMDANLPEPVRDVFFVERDGQKFVRFFLSPEDEKYGPDLEKYLKARGVPFRRETSQIVGVRTVSRSLIFLDPKTGFVFSYKPSTSHTYLDNGDRVAPMRWAHLNRRLNDYFKSMEGELKYLRIAPEALAVGFPAVQLGGKAHGDFAFQVRLMNEVARGEKIHLSGFVFYDKVEATRIAEAAGETYDSFWTKAFILKGKAMAEMAGVLGFHYTSSHAQNFRWELNPDGTLSDHVVMLDLSDGRPNREIFESNGQHQLLQEWQAMVSRTNPIEKESLGISAFVEPMESHFQEALSQGFNERIAEVLLLEDYHFAQFTHAYSKALGERGTVIAIKDLKERVAARKAARLHIKPRLNLR